FLLAAIIILPFIYKKIWIAKADFFKMLYLAFVGITLNITFFFLGLRLTTSINVPIINAAAPIFLIFGSVWYLHEKIKLKVLIGTLLSMIGLLIIILEPLLSTGPDGSIVGNLLVLLSVLSAVIYTLLLKKFRLPYPALTIVFWTFFLGSLFFLPAFLSEALILHPFAHMNSRSFIGIGFGAIFSSALAYFLYNFGVEYIDGAEIGIFYYLEPIATILVALPLLGEKITLLYILGSIIVLIGIFIAEAHIHYHPHLLSKKPN
ncbi:MAG TPA: DMT family transporter, partial [Patescibacteria group bacterium]